MIGIDDPTVDTHILKYVGPRGLNTNIKGPLFLSNKSRHNVSVWLVRY